MTIERLHLALDPLRLDTISTTTDPQTFAQRFTEIQCKLNWRRMWAENWPVETNELIEPSELDQLFTPFRGAWWGVYCGRRTPWTHPMRVEEVRNRIRAFPKKRRQSMEHFAELFRRKKNVVLEVPAFDLGGGNYFILDCTHRVCGLAMSGSKFRLQLHIIRGPVDVDVLPDLHYWVRADKQSRPHSS